LPRPTFHLIAGPNGAGKTTFYEQWLRVRTDAEFVNPDLLVREALGRWSQTRAESELGQQLAEARRDALIAAGESLVTESTFSHPSKLELVEAVLATGYRLAVYHLGVADPDFAVERVADRAVLGGHPVPEAKVRGRYERGGPLIRQAVLKAHFGYVFDNSVDGRPPRPLLSFQGGTRVKRVARLPAWAGQLYGRD
jgi:predicted ABC-type ATPase